MKITSRSKLLGALVLTACGGSAAAPIAPAPIAPVASAVPSVAPSAASPPRAAFPSSPPGAGKKLAELKLTLPDEWKRKDQAEDDCVFGEGPRSQDAPPGMVKICRIKEAPSTTAEGFVAYKTKTELWDKGVTAELVGPKEDWPSGYAATYSVRAPVDPKHPTLSFFAVWKVGGELLSCDGRGVGNEKQRDQINAICRSATW